MKSPTQVVKAIDGEVHRWHMHRTRDWSKYKIARVGLSLDVLAYAIYARGCLNDVQVAPFSIIGLPTAMLLSQDFTQNLFYPIYEKNTTDTTRALSNRHYQNWKIMFNMIRPYSLLVGTACTGKCVVDLVNLVANQEAIDAKEFITYVSLAAETLALSSSIYIKDKDPKLLERENVLKRAYNWLTCPPPQLAPVQVPEYSTLVDKL
ncbi:hypothetical protein J4438_03315 [Candidatus Woesearchaeota archaeon]|nr:hypothetical protein [Candidatus Woesearchaeota archaeon]